MGNALEIKKKENEELRKQLSLANAAAESRRREAEQALRESEANRKQKEKELTESESKRKEREQELDKSATMARELSCKLEKAVTKSLREETEELELYELTGLMKNYYDVNVMIDNVLHLAKQGAYLRIGSSLALLLSEFKPERMVDELMALQWECSVIAVLGLYNKGKTFLLELLSDMMFPTGEVIHTEGLGYKIIQSNACNHILLDTAGLHSPVLNTDLAVKKSTEFFMRDLTFDLADFLIVVVTDLTSPDEEYIMQLAKRLASSNDPRKTKRLHVIHNFLHANTHKKAQLLWDQQVMVMYSRRECQPGTNRINAMNPNTQQLETQDVHFLDTTNKIRHIYLLNNRSPIGRVYNQFVAEQLRQWMRDTRPVGEDYRVVDRLLERAGWALSRYVDFNGKLELTSNPGSDAFPAKEYPLKLGVAPLKGDGKAKGKERESDEDSQVMQSYEPVLRPIHLDIHTGATSSDQFRWSYHLRINDQSQEELVVAVECAGVTGVECTPNDHGIEVVFEKSQDAEEKLHSFTHSIPPQDMLPKAVTQEHTNVSQRDYGTFRKIIPISDDYDSNSLQSQLKGNGLLILTLQKKKVPRPIKIVLS